MTVATSQTMNERVNISVTCCHNKIKYINVWWFRWWWVIDGDGFVWRIVETSVPPPDVLSKLCRSSDSFQINFRWISFRLITHHLSSTVTAFKEMKNSASQESCSNKSTFICAHITLENCEFYVFGFRVSFSCSCSHLNCLPAVLLLCVFSVSRSPRSARTWSAGLCVVTGGSLCSIVFPTHALPCLPSPLPSDWTPFLLWGCLWSLCLSIFLLPVPSPKARRGNNNLTLHCRCCVHTGLTKSQMRRLNALSTHWVSVQSTPQSLLAQNASDMNTDLSFLHFCVCLD